LFDFYVCDFSIAGTKYFMSPEMLASSTNYSKDFGMKSDIWSLGVVLYQILYGLSDYKRVELLSVFFTGSTIFINQTMPFVSRYGKFNELIKKILTIDPKQRPDIKEVKRLWQQIRT
jgi:serine/threonine protein kinase